MKKILLIITAAMTLFAQNAMTQNMFSQELLSKAESGDAFAQTALGQCYHTGKGITKNIEKAEYWFNKAADKGVMEAMKVLTTIYYNSGKYTKAMDLSKKLSEYGFSEYASNVAVMYAKGRGVQTNPAQAAAWYKKAAELGNAKSQNLLGTFYMQGKYVEQDYKKGARWFEKAMELDEKEAMVNLAVCYAYGYGVTPDYLWALSCLNASGMDNNDNIKGIVQQIQKGAESGQPTALYAMGRLYEEINEKGKAQRYFDKALKSGDSSVHFFHGVLLAEKGEYKEAVNWLKQAADKGNAYAQTYLGTMYYEGTGVTKDLSTAAELFSKALGKGEANAIFNLALMYKNGDGVPQDDTISAIYMELAAQEGISNSAAEYFTGMNYYEGKGVEQDYGKAVEWLKIAANKNLSDAFEALGECYYYGHGVEQNYITAAEWLKRCVNSNHPKGKATNLLSKIYRKGIDGLPQDITEADRLLKKAAEIGDDTSRSTLERIRATVFP